MEIEVPAETPRTFSHITRKKIHLLKLETLLMCIYYPCAIGSGLGPAPDGAKKWSRQTWLPRPRFRTAKGFGIFAGVNSSIAVPYLAATTMFTKLPAFRNAQPATHWPPARSAEDSGWKAKDQKGDPPPGEPEQPCFPTLIFSHGLGGSRTCYSSVCGEFASYGFVVCAIEHRDGSGPRTYVNHPDSGEGSYEDIEANANINHDPKEVERGHGEVDYIFPKDNPLDTAPHNDKGVDTELRKAQIQLRLAEIGEAYAVLKHIGTGNGEYIARRNLRRKGYVGASSRGLEGIDWGMWKDRFSLQRITLAGHSFGAATTVEALRHIDHHFPWIGQGIIYDIWGAAVQKLGSESQYRIRRPLLGVSSEAFMYWPSNNDATSEIAEEARNEGMPVWLLTLRGTVHLTQSDLSILYPRMCSLYMKMTANPKRALDLNIGASLEFLKKVMPDEAAILDRAMSDEGILDVDVIGDMPDDNKPPEEWIAVRLNVPHRVGKRIMPKLAREIKRIRSRKTTGKESTPSEEIWMHAKASEDEVQAYRKRMRSQKASKDSDSVDNSTVNVEVEEDQTHGRKEGEGKKAENVLSSYSSDEESQPSSKSDDERQGAPYSGLETVIN